MADTSKPVFTEESYVQYSVKELVIALHEKIDKNDAITDERLTSLEGLASRAKGALAVIVFLLGAVGAHGVGLI